MLERILSEGHAEFSVVVMNSGHEESEAPPKNVLDRMARQWRARGSFLFRLYRRFDERKFRASPDAFEMVDVADLLAEVPVVEVSPRRTKFSDFIEGDDLERLNDTAVDLFIRLGFRILRGGVLRSAPLGVWSFHHGDNRVNRGGPAGYWEVLLRWPTTGSVLQILSEDLDGGLVLDRSWSATHPLSAHLNRNSFFWKSAAMVPRKLAELVRVGTSAFLERHRAEQDPVSVYSQRLFLQPTSREMIGLWARWLARYVRLVTRARLFREQWQLRFGFRDEVLGSPWRFKKIIPPKDRIWADPHVLERDGRHYAFIEEMPNGGKGHISVIEIASDGSYTQPVRVLEEPHHLSYPALFEWDGGLYMVPEAGGCREIRAYRCTDFPGAWEPAGVLMRDVHAVDATLFEHESRWWMFVTIAEHPGVSTHDELFLFHADTPLSSDWTPHPMNPIVSDVRRARPAGPLFHHEGRIIRPGQDSARSYGDSLRLMEITELSADHYQEREVAHLTPTWEEGLVGTHTFVRAGRLNMIDVKVWRRRIG